MEEVTSAQSVQSPQFVTNQNHSPLPVSRKLSKKVLILVTILVLLILGSGLYYLSTQSKSEQPTVTRIPTPPPDSSKSVPLLTEIQSVDTLNPAAVIKIPFVRDGNIYLYEDGKEKVVAKPARKSSQTACNHLVFPFLSPNGKYIAYIEQVGDEPGYGGCLGGILRVVTLETGKTMATKYNIRYFNWNADSHLAFSTIEERQNDTITKPAEFVLFDPANGKELAKTEVFYSKSGGASSYSILSANKQILYKDKKYYLKNNNTEKLLFSDNEVESFEGWSSNGRYALFDSTKQTAKDFDAIELVVDADNPSAKPLEITVGRGGAGGDFSTGRKWYFEKGFVAYCREELYYVDGTKPLELTNDSGGGCHNEEGFVATSPDGEYAFVKFKDRFELHTKDGSKKVITETAKVLKGRWVPKNLIWINNDYMAIFERTSSGDYGTGEPKVYLFDRKANTIKSLIEDAYLGT